MDYIGLSCDMAYACWTMFLDLGMSDMQTDRLAHSIHLCEGIFQIIKYEALESGFQSTDLLF